jgi:hypothetical protein
LLDLLRALGLPRARRGVKLRKSFNTRIASLTALMFYR